MQMWSGYRNWLPGHAVVGDNFITSDAPAQTLNTPGSSGDVDSPFFTDNAGFSGGPGDVIVRTWTGNRLSAGYFQAVAGYLSANAIYTIGGASSYSLGENAGTGLLNIPNGTGIRDNFLTSPINRGLSKLMFNGYELQYYSGSTAVMDEQFKATSFMYHLPGYQAQWGGQTLSRTRPCSWRMIPTRYTEVAGGSTVGATNNTFKLEIMFDVPIMHCDHKLASAGLYGVNDPAAFVDRRSSPYRYLTVSGQGIIRYGKTTKP